MVNQSTTAIDDAPHPLFMLEVTRETLHRHWPFIREGLEAIIARLSLNGKKPERIPDWIPPDVYDKLANDASRCVLAMRGEKYLGFAIYYKDLRPFSRKPDLFIWAGYAIPFKQRSQTDNVPEAFAAVWRYLVVVAKTTFGTRVIRLMTTPERAKAFRRKIGCSLDFVSCSVDVG
jgi:hypothetical protein